MRVLTPAILSARVSGLLTLVLGLVIWRGHSPGLVPLHMIFGLLLVRAMLVLAAIAVRRGVSTGLVGAAMLWAALTIGLGVMQARLFVGSAHWLIQVVHLLFGLGAMGLSERLAGTLKRSASR